jgi:hypothetical protein
VALRGRRLYVMKPEKEIEAEIISVTLGGPRRPPVELGRVAKDIGVEAICWTHSRDTFTHFHPKGPVIYLSPTESGARIRFIFAHELAHVMIRRPEALRLIQNRGLARLLDDEERLANRIAATLLVPDSWVQAMKATRFPLAKLENIARLAGIPMPMLVTRMAASKIDIALLQWRQVGHSWYVTDRSGVPDCLQGYVELTESGRRAIDRLGNDESGMVVDCRIGGKCVTITGRGYRRGKRGEHAFQFIAPSYDICF